MLSIIVLITYCQFVSHLKYNPLAFGTIPTYEWTRHIKLSNVSAVLKDETKNLDYVGRDMNPRHSVLSADPSSMPASLLRTSLLFLNI